MAPLAVEDTLRLVRPQLLRLYFTSQNVGTKISNNSQLILLQGAANVNVDTACLLQMVRSTFSSSVGCKTQ